MPVPAASPPASSSLLVETCNTAAVNFRCCLCLDIRSKNQTILRAECFHRFCRICFNTEDTILLLKQDKCPACQKDLDETLSEVLLSGECMPRLKEATDTTSSSSSYDRPTMLVLARHHTISQEETISCHINDDKRGSVALPREGQTMSRNALNDERKKPAKEMLPVGASVAVPNIRKTFEELKEMLPVVGASVAVPNNRKTFEQRIMELAAFKAKHGHCNAPRQLTSEYKSLGEWCSKARSHYKQIQEGKVSSRPLSHSQIESLDALGFEWDRKSANHIFLDERFTELAAFKAEYGHCNPPRIPSSKYYSLGQWCCKVRGYHKQIQEGKIPRGPLPQDQIRRLEAMGFEWVRNNAKFEERFAELAALKAKHGHCDTLITTPSSTPLGQWCINLRYHHQQMREGNIPRRSLSLDQIRRLDELGFKWSKAKLETSGEESCPSNI